MEILFSYIEIAIIHERSHFLTRSPQYPIGREFVILSHAESCLSYMETSLTHGRSDYLIEIPHYLSRRSRYLTGRPRYVISHGDLVIFVEMY